MVWVGQAMMPRILAGELQPVCLPCSYTFLARDDLTVTLAPEQILQLADLGVLPDAVSFVDRVNEVLRRRRAARKPPAAS